MTSTAEKPSRLAAGRTAFLRRDQRAAKTTAVPAPGPLAIPLLFALSVIVALLGHITGLDALRLLGLFGAVFFGVGAAPLQLVGDMDLAARLGLSALIGFTALFGVGAIMADIRPLWHPVLAAALLGAAAGSLHLVGVLRGLRSRRNGAGAAPRPWRRVTARSAAAIRSRLLRRRPPVATALAVLGTILWLGAAIATPRIDPGIGGLLTKMSPLWFAGIILVLASIAFAGRDERLLAFGVVSLALATTLTPALVYGTPRSQSAAKHIDLVLAVLHQHHITPSAGIYQAYSAFFAGNAWLCRVAGVSNPVGLATYWPVLLALVRVVELRFLAGRTVTSVRARWIAVTLVILVDCVGADYFSPQSLGYVMGLAMFGLVIKGVTVRPLGRRGMFAVLALSSLALGPAHELTPFMVAGALVVLAVLGQAPYWTWVVVALPAAEWASLEHKVLSHSFSFSQVFSVSNFAPPKTLATPGLQRMPIVGLSSHALLLGLVLLILAAAIGLRRNVRARWAWAYALCPIVGLGFIAINPYGNEGIFRTALFGIPWLALLAVHSELHGKLRPWRRLPLSEVGLLGGLVVLLTTFLVGAYALDGSDVLRLTDLKATQIFDDRAPPNSFLLPLGYGDNPAQQPSFGVEATSLTARVTSLPWELVATPYLRTRGRLAVPDLQLLTRSYRQIADAYRAAASSRLYIVWSRSLLLYSAEYGLQSEDQTRQWLRLLLTSAEWHVVFHSGGTYLFSLRGSAVDPTGTG